MAESWVPASREPRRRAQVRLSSLIGSSVAIAIGVIVLLGHAIGSVRLVHLTSASPAMVTESAIEFVVLGTALLAWLLVDIRATRVAATVVGIAVAAYSLLALVIYITGSAMEIAIGMLPAAHGRVPGTQSSHAAVLFLLYGMLLAMVPWPRLRVGRIAVTTLSSVALMVAAFGLVYRVTYLYREGGIIGMGVHTLIAFMMLNTALICARPEEGIVSLMTSDFNGGLLARLLVPTTLAVPFAIALVISRFTTDDGSASAEALLIVTSLIVAILVGLAIFSSVQIQRADAERQVLMAQLRDLAGRDPMTGLANRRIFTSRLEEAVRTADSTGARGLAVIVLDLDGLKPANDTFGHAAGDALIRGIGSLLAHHLRGTDLIARLGGDEFGILLSPVTADDADRLAGRLVRSVANASFSDGQNSLRSTISAGVVHSVAKGRSVDELLRLADSAMYVAKGSGGNDYAWGTPRERLPGTKGDPIDTDPQPRHNRRPAARPTVES